ncbi:glycosyltransferase family 2 protein [Franconibacter pulveris 1160]|uniref:glycosyltransferase family 2 protein n=1 Tax=Franconibacter pulveris TaxID=435910 RepID=UPI0004675651|nr:glycosyltransferase family 2 protein [Franconibacter pulveris]
MKVSIITATYNSAKTLPDTLRSLGSQTYDNIEYIVIDGASKDNTLDIVHDNYKKTVTIISEPDKGIYDALNKGINVATGDVIGFLHSDDILAYPDVIRDVVACFNKDNCDAVYGDLEYVSKDDLNKTIRLWKSGEFHRSKIQLGWMPPHPSFYMKKSCYDKFGSFSLDYRISADYESLLRYLWKESITLSYIPQVLVKMRVGGISNRSLSSMINKSFEDIKAMKANKLIWPIALISKNLCKLPQFIRK